MDAFSEFTDRTWDGTPREEYDTPRWLALEKSDDSSINSPTENGHSNLGVPSTEAAWAGGLVVTETSNYSGGLGVENEREFDITPSLSSLAAKPLN